MRPAHRSVRATTVCLLFGLLVAMLAGCGGLPDSGSAGSGRRVQRIPDEPLQVAARGPRAGEGPDEVVDGFLHAGAGFDDNHGVARLFLTGAAKTKWTPGQSTVVYRDDASLLRPGRATGQTWLVTVSAPVWATIDGTGRMTLARPGTTSRTEIRLERRDGQWRIDELDPHFGLWMAKYEFERTYTPLRLSFVAVGSRLLVPDLRWFAGSRASLATAVVKQLLNGPPPDLGAGVVTGFPAGTRLGVEAVPITGGTATVELSEVALRADPLQRDHLWAQLRTTLRQLPQVSRIAVSVAGVPYPLGKGGTARGLDDAGGYTEEVPLSRPVLALRSGRLVALDLVGGEPVRSSVDGSLGGVALTGLRAVALMPEPQLVVGVDTAGSHLIAVRAGTGRVVLASAPGLLDPVADRIGWVWTASASRPGQLLVTRAQSAAGAVRAPPRWLHPAWLAGRRVLSLDVARDGARVAVMSVGSDGATRLDVAAIVRDSAAAPTALTASRTVGQSLSAIADVSWADATHLVVLAQPATADGDVEVGPLTPFEVEVGGLVTELPPVRSAQQVWAGAGLSAVLVRTAANQLLLRSGSGWRPVGSGLSVAIAP